MIGHTGGKKNEAPRLQALEARDLFHQTEQKASFGSFLAPEICMIFGDGVGTSLVRGPYCQFGVGLMRFYIGTAQLKKVL